MNCNTLTLSRVFLRKLWLYLYYIYLESMYFSIKRYKRLFSFRWINVTLNNASVTNHIISFWRSIIDPLVLL